MKIEQIFYGKLQPYFDEATKIREAVFVEEQGFKKDLELDQFDERSFHIVIFIKGMAVATARLIVDDEGERFVIGRVAVLTTFRKEGLGKMLIQSLLKYAKSLASYKRVVVRSQLGAVPFYEQQGFKCQGDAFEEEGVPHVMMSKELRTRGFEVARGYEGMVKALPVRGTNQSAGYDLSIIEEIIIQPGETVFAPTGIKAYMQSDELLEIHIRSSVAAKRNVWCVNNVGIVDADYYNNAGNDGHIMVALFNGGKETVVFESGERVAQAIFTKYLITDSDEQTEFLERVGGFGSTGRHAR